MTTTSARSLLWLVVAWYLVVMVLSGALLLMQQLLSIDADYISVVQFAPVSGVVILLVVARSRMKAMAPSTVGRRRMAARLLLGLGLTLGFAAVMVVACTVTHTLRTESPFPSAGLLLAYVMLQLAGAFGEEVGWRGFLQPALETRMPRLAACLVTGALWALWHVQMFTDPMTAAGFTLSTLALSIAFGYLAIGNRWQRGVIAGLMHAVVNIAMFLAVDPVHFVVAATPLSLVLLIPLGAVLLWKRLSPRTTVQE
jgi:membrane protease YdiL (CAAX protease family)